MKCPHLIIYLETIIKDQYSYKIIPNKPLLNLLTKLHYIYVSEKDWYYPAKLKLVWKLDITHILKMWYNNHK